MLSHFLRHAAFYYLKPYWWKNKIVFRGEGLEGFGVEKLVLKLLKWVEATLVWKPFLFGISAQFGGFSFRGLHSTG